MYRFFNELVMVQADIHSVKTKADLLFTKAESDLPRHRKKISRIGVYTSGGDAPGMNAAIRSVVRTCHHYNCEVVGIEYGYRGIYNGFIRTLNFNSVGNIIQRGGTILKSARFPEMEQMSVREDAAYALKVNDVDALVCIGGDGSLTGAHVLWKEHGIPVAGIPGTIDNDLFGTDVTIGFDTAINTGLRAIDQIRDTANSHDRIFLLEVMGRNSGYIAINVGIGGGATAIVIPEDPLTVDQIAERIRLGEERQKKSSIIVVAEGEKSGNSFQIAEELERKYDYVSRVCVLGHIQRGGSPSARDREVASIFGAMAVSRLLEGYSNFMTGLVGQEPTYTLLEDAIHRRKTINSDMSKLSAVLSA